MSKERPEVNTKKQKALLLDDGRDLADVWSEGSALAKASLTLSGLLLLVVNKLEVFRMTVRETR